MMRAEGKGIRRPRFSVIEDRLLEDGRPLGIPRRIVAHCLAAAGYAPAVYIPSVSPRVIEHIFRISTFIGAALVGRKRSGTKKGGVYVGD